MSGACIGFIVKETHPLIVELAYYWRRTVLSTLAVGAEARLATQDPPSPSPLLPSYPSSNKEGEGEERAGAAGYLWRRDENKMPQIEHRRLLCNKISCKWTLLRGFLFSETTAAAVSAAGLSCNSPDFSVGRCVAA